MDSNFLTGLLIVAIKEFKRKNINNGNTAKSKKIKKKMSFIDNYKP